MITFNPISTVLDKEGKKRLGEIVRQLRENLTQREFANSLGIGQSTLSMWESGKVTPDLENLEKLAEVWGKTPEEFVAYLYGRKILNGSVFDAIESMSINELAELQILISRQMAQKLNKAIEKPTKLKL
jgi:transcriptional regulator with XRE-family HTH domain